MSPDVLVQLSSSKETAANCGQIEQSRTIDIIEKWSRTNRFPKEEKPD